MSNDERTCEYFLTTTDVFGSPVVCKETTYRYKLLKDHPDFCAREDFCEILESVLVSPDLVAHRGSNSENLGDSVINHEEIRYNFYKGLENEESEKYVKVVVEYVGKTGDVVTTHLMSPKKYESDLKRNVETIYQAE